MRNLCIKSSNKHTTNTRDAKRYTALAVDWLHTLCTTMLRLWWYWSSSSSKKCWKRLWERAILLITTSLDHHHCRSVHRQQIHIQHKSKWNSMHMSRFYTMTGRLLFLLVCVLVLFIRTREWKDVLKKTTFVSWEVLLMLMGCVALDDDDGRLLL